MNIDQAAAALIRAADLDEIAALRPGAGLIQLEMSRRAPVDEGDLAGSIRTEENQPQRGTIQVGPDEDHAWYGHFTEFGTKFQPAQPWFRPAIDHASGPAAELVMKQIVDQVSRAFR